MEQRDRVVASDRARHELRWFANTPAWREPLVGEVRWTRLPRRAPKRSPLPRELHHLFWNADISKLEPAEDGSYMAGRLLEAPDIRAWRWAFDNVSREDIQTAMSRRGINPRTRALVKNWFASDQ